jgi:hypothetical protein
MNFNAVGTSIIERAAKCKGCWCAGRLWLLYSVLQESSALYEGESTEKLKHVLKIENTAQLSCKLTTLIIMV